MPLEQAQPNKFVCLTPIKQNLNLHSNCWEHCDADADGCEGMMTMMKLNCTPGRSPVHEEAFGIVKSLSSLSPEQATLFQLNILPQPPPFLLPSFVPLIIPYPLSSFPSHLVLPFLPSSPPPAPKSRKTLIRQLSVKIVECLLPRSAVTCVFYNGTIKY